MKSIAALAALAAAATLAACGSDGDSPADPAPKCSTSSATGTTITKAGTALCVGSTAVVRNSFKTASAVLRLTISTIEKASAGDLKTFNLKPDRTKGKDLYYVRGEVEVLRVTNPGAFIAFRPFDQVSLELTGNGRGDTPFSLGNDKCESGSINEDDLQVGATTSACRFFLVDSGAEPSHASYVNLDDIKELPITDDDRVTWYPQN